MHGYWNKSSDPLDILCNFIEKGLVLWKNCKEEKKERGASIHSYGTPVGYRIDKFRVIHLPLDTLARRKGEINTHMLSASKRGERVVACFTMRKFDVFLGCNLLHMASLISQRLFIFKRYVSYYRLGEMVMLFVWWDWERIFVHL